jgi:hypothetical protein
LTSGRFCERYRCAMTDKSHCSQCNEFLIEIDHYGERLVGCIECNRWTRNGWLYRQLPEEELEALRARLKARDE